jgi:hypothetical protein
MKSSHGKKEDPTLKITKEERDGDVDQAVKLSRYKAMNSNPCMAKVIY